VKVVILAGGHGTRLSEETAIRPKPMVEIGGRPILWHIMKGYSAAGFHDFVICLGYRGDVIKDFFASYNLHASDVTFDLAANSMTTHTNDVEPWRVTLVNTGLDTMTGGRLKRARPYLPGDAPFLATYGDCVSDIDMRALLEFHRNERALATMTAIQPPGRFGAIALGADETQITQFHEKPRGDGAWINGGFFVFEPQVLDYIEGDSTVLEQEPFQDLAHGGHLVAYKHTGYWQNMDTLRDRNLLEAQWASGDPPWKIW
jgi:glucose-1-phosphate cytidylyltransferase